MRKQILSLAAVAALAMVGVGATTTAAQAAPEEIAISEVLINTAPDGELNGTKIDGVEIVKPSAANIQGYKIEACSAPASPGGTSTLSPVATMNAETDQTRTAASSDGGYVYGFAAGASLDRLGGVRLIDANDNVVDAVTFNAADTAVAECLTGSPLGNPDVAPAPTDVTSAQRLNAGTSNDTGAFAAASPTFPTSRGAENTIGD